MLRTDCFEHIKKVAEPTHYSIGWRIEEKMAESQTLFHWFENENFIIGFWPYQQKHGGSIRVFPKYYARETRPMVNLTLSSESAEDIFFFLSCLDDPTKLSLCVGFDWTGELLESILKTERLAA